MVAVVVYLACVNALAFAAFGVDKSRAKRGAWRISEKALMLLAVAGGSLGALLGMHVFHHKTRKPLFSIGVPVLLVATVALVAFLVAGHVFEQHEDVSTDFEQATIDYVIDGDTIDVVTGENEHRVRLAGIDAPESASHDESLNTEEGAAATEYLRAMLPVGRTVYLQKDTSETDKYGRLVRYVWFEVPNNPVDQNEIATKMVNAIVVEAGYAQAKRYWPDEAYADELAQAQERAIAAGAGVSYLWAQ